MEALELALRRLAAAARAGPDRGSPLLGLLVRRRDRLDRDAAERVVLDVLMVDVVGAGASRLVGAVDRCVAGAGRE